MSTITEPIYEQQKFISAPIDGAVHSFADTVASGLDPYNRDYIKLYPDTKYQATYKVIKNGEIVNNTAPKNTEHNIAKYVHFFA